MQASRKADSPASENARNLQTSLLQRISRRTQTQVADAAGIDKSAMCRIVSGERGVFLHELYDLLDALDLAVVECDGEVVSVPSEEMEALRVLARKGLGREG